ncbi:hypothetical protein C7446_2306 [Kushneria sinocarnis]|uniref:Tail assembly chaperone n=1 Tax=Kushneria sinocarnis TaxID=595502 RepID=A0A420WVJ7_9GAMM|nr:tail fiber assembly protein [Kushneria sinocarnis]RKR02588.1 hypothetical protein C7446_2306 [Kushneria sinocarnis]
MKFSPSELSFLPDALLEAYRKAGSLPDDLVSISDDQYREYALSSTPAGKVLSADSNGMPAWVDVPTPEPQPAETRRASAIARIDTRAGAVRAAYASDGILVDAEYQQALTAAQNWDAAGRPADDVPDDVQAWADATGNDAGWAADDIISTAEAWSHALSQIRRVRLTGKEAIRAAADDADFDALAQQYIDQLEQIEAAVPEDM